MNCPHCQTVIPTTDLGPGQWVACGKCEASVQVPDDQHADATLETGDTFFADRKTAQRRMFRSFRVQSLVVVGLVVIVAGSIFGIAKWQAAAQGRRVASIRDLGGVVLYDYQFNDSQSRFDYASEPREGAWLSKTFGPDFVYRVTAVDFGRDHDFLKSELFGDQDLASIRVPDFEPSINDSQLEVLREIESLQLLSLAGQPITDDGVKRIKQFNRLVYLDLHDTRITDLAGSSLAALRTLKFLDLRDTAFSSAGYRELQRLLPHTEIRRGPALILH